MRRLITCLQAWNPAHLRAKVEELEAEARHLSRLLELAGRKIGALQEENRQLAVMKEINKED
jgi:hypothetical protein